MQILNKNDYELITRLFSSSQNVLLSSMSTYLKKHYTKENIIEKPQYICAIGEIPVVLVAHLDTVFSVPANEIYYDTTKNVMWSPDGLGADDRAGVYAIIKLIQKGYRPHVIFTTGEEKGGIGAQALIKDYPAPFVAGIKYLIELDRRGDCDCVFYDCDNREFTEYVSNFGFIENYGTYSDIADICPQWGIAGVNLSIGYRNEHSVTETLHIEAINATIRKVGKMLKDAGSAPEFKFIPCIYPYGKSKYYQGGWPGYDDDWAYSGFYKCSQCGKYFSEYEIFPVKTANHSRKFYCPDCLNESRINWCEECGEPFEVNAGNKNQKRCYDCKKVKVSSR